MSIKFFKKSELDRKINLSIHKTGKLGFSSDAATKFKLDVNTTVDIGYDEVSNGDILYMALHHNNDGEFKVSKAGQYYYVNTKLIFDTLKMNYVNNSIVYELEQFENSEFKGYKLTRKKKEERGKDN